MEICNIEYYSPEHGVRSFRCDMEAGHVLPHKTGSVVGFNPAETTALEDNDRAIRRRLQENNKPVRG